MVAVQDIAGAVGSEWRGAKMAIEAARRGYRGVSRGASLPAQGN